MPILYEPTDATIRYQRAQLSSKLRKFSSSPGFWTGFGVATIVFVIALPILAEPVATFLKRKA